MKNKWIYILFILFCLSFISNKSLKAQDWNIQTSNTTEHLYNVFYLNANSIWAVGNGPTIIYSSNGGSNWVQQTVSVGGFINDIYFRNNNLGWAVASSGKVLKTINGGNTWVTIDLGIMTNIYSVFFVSDTKGFLVGDSGLLRQSTDGGDTWNSITSNTSSNLWSLRFINSNVGYAVEAFGEVIKTTNGGNTWNSVSSGFAGVLWDVSVVNEQIVYASGDNGALYNTTNGGTSWTTLNTGLTQIIFGVNFFNANQGYIAGESGKILYTTNGGTNWSDQSLLVPTNIYRLRFFDENTGIIVGDGGLVATFELLTPQNFSIIIDEITTTTANLTSSISNDNGSVITSRGFVYSKSNTNPTISSNDGIVNSGQGLGSFSSEITNLEPATKYYISSFATNLNGTNYSDILKFTTGLSINLDGNDDGILDTLQTHVFTIFDENTDNFITIESLENDSIFDVFILKGNEKDYLYPLGLMTFKVKASFANIKIYYHGVSSLENYTYRKQKLDGTFYDYTRTTFAIQTINGNPTAVVTLRLQDGKTGDLDGTVNGIIYDPGGPSISTVAIPSISEWARIIIISSFAIFGVWWSRKKFIS